MTPYDAIIETRRKRREQFKAMIDTAEWSDAEIVTVAGRDNDGKLLFVACYAEGESAVDLEALLGGALDEPEADDDVATSDDDAGGAVR